ncbi:lipase maturation factor family protein [Ornithinimicrobium sp. F0845]|uniref:lipase maturation factor family protein n=1 Tax=Ornithinimicrobium sp. F0845 TaxID=2926412 RepID=UPI001FF24FAB|nr:lipase maturation factor family protein [Ornithinimicrobium sp. F0845]MCK0113944.1 lipase maturation factor family protein [Ornithinimicrobium sp. F0845]
MDAVVTWGAGWFWATDHELSRVVLQRGIAALYVVAFVAVLRQFRPLLGERGLLPVPRSLERAGARAGPTLFRWHYSDALLVVVGGVGVLVALSLVVGLPQRGPAWVPMLAFAVLYLLYLSVVNVGQVFYGFGWESLLLEAGFLAAFLGSDRVPVPTLVLLAFCWLVFRVEFGAGLIKMRGDPCWRDLTCLYYHHETQPMPGPFSPYFHALPKPLHRVEVGANHVVQLGVPFLLFAPQPVATWAAALVVITQLWLVVSGNFAWLNWLTLLLACAAVSDDVLAAVLPWSPGGAAAGEVGAGELPADLATGPAWFAAAVVAMAAVVLALSYRPARNLLSRSQQMNASFNRWHLVGAYGAFGSITRRRDEVVVEGTLADDPADEDAWREYEFKGKPGPVHQRPRQWAPYHLRLDWGMWFLALGSPAQHVWFERFLRRLLEADPATLRLLHRDPFDGQRPRWVRARVFRYRYATRAERRRDRVWWVRDERGLLVDPRRIDEQPRQREG